MSQKLFVLDTSTLLYSAGSLQSFGSEDVVIPYVVLEELDRFKSHDGEVGSNARQVARELNRLRQQGPIDEGVEITEKGGRLRVELNYQDRQSSILDIKKNDDRILNVCLGLQKEHSQVILVTKDINLAVRADVLGVTAQDFDSDKMVNSVADIYPGLVSVQVADELIDAFYQGEDIYLNDLDLFANQYVSLTGELDPGKSALARHVSDREPLEKLKKVKWIWGVSPRNREQHFAMDALLDPKITLVTLTGPAGTGKTLISLACALQQVQDEGRYSRLVVSRPVQPLGKDIGYLPGDIYEKMDPWMGPVKDSLEFLTRGKDPNRNMYQEMIDLKMLEVEPLTYIRGRSMPNTIFVLDEGQDMSLPEVKTIVSRMGEGSKLVLIGDVMQISNPYLNATNNGLSNVIERFKPYKFASHVTLVKGERSELATTASKIL